MTKKDNAKKIGKIMKSIQKMYSLHLQIETELYLGRCVLLNLEKAKTDKDKEEYLETAIGKERIQGLIKLYGF